jgi:mono/diheme cytochrome c family protein
MWLFILTVVFALVYLAFYPGLGSYPGMGQWSGQGQHRSDAQRMRAELAPLYARFTATPLDQLSQDPQALAIGQRHFMNHCAQCHGSDARGSKGYPNLTQGPSAWLGPLSGEHIVQTISQGRQGVMPAMGAAIGDEAAISDLAHYVLSLSGSPHNEIKAFSGKKVAVKGFMLPLKVEGGLVTELLLMRDQSMCCFGTVPKINEWIAVKMTTSGIKPVMDQAVTLYGTLKVGAMRENGYLVGIYQMDGMTIDGPPGS